MKTKLYQLAMTLFLVISLFGINNSSVQAQETQSEIKTYGYYKYQYDQATDSIQILGYLGDEEVVRIPSQIEGKTVTKIDGFGDFHETIFNIKAPTVKELYIPEGVVEIGSDAFMYCIGLEKVEFPDGLKVIGEYAFCECTSLTEISIPDSVTKVGNSAFAGCSKLTKVKLSNNLTVIEESSFSYCNIKSIQIPDKVTKIEKGAFDENKLKEFKIPSSVTYIGARAFAFNKLTRVEIPSNITRIEAYTFWGNTSLREVTIPSSVKKIGYRAFLNCKNLKKITIKGTKTKKISKEAFSRIHKKATFDVPNKLKKKYKKMLIAGNNFNEKTMKIK